MFIHLYKLTQGVFPTSFWPGCSVFAPEAKALPQRL